MAYALRCLPTYPHRRDAAEARTTGDWDTYDAAETFRRQMANSVHLEIVEVES